MDRLEYAAAHRQQYLDWCGAVERSPYSALDKLEFAIISAHCPMAAAISGWENSRSLIEIDDIANALDAAGVIAPRHKAAYIWAARTAVADGRPLPHPDYREYRETVKWNGLGYCKLSFAACLIDPLGSDIICLDTHMLQVYWGWRPTVREVNTLYRNISDYSYIESLVVLEAAEVGLPPFAYQWAVWDWKRAKVDLIPPNPHDFLWKGGRREQQLALFSSLS